MSFQLTSKVEHRVNLNKIFKGEQGEQFYPYFFNTVGVNKKVFSGRCFSTLRFTGVMY
ncbi:hypothetical protein Xish_00974 [Xenorhabdus ishibashii]|uniref:Uncharacterized protein n=1 Tax=Xenorhabdus ishibashii TaxID=1034471 RepID=A0A2D0KET4_9GAMM|nr:hypothetical protein Xish_00974 [Xenorhabdus ishibashii]